MLRFDGVRWTRFDIGLPRSYLLDLARGPGGTLSVVGSNRTLIEFRP